MAYKCPRGRAKKRAAQCAALPIDMLCDGWGAKRGRRLRGYGYAIHAHGMDAKAAYTQQLTDILHSPIL